MTDMPEKIYAGENVHLFSKWWQERNNRHLTEYTRSDIAWNEALEAAGEKIRAFVKDLRDDAEKMGEILPQAAYERLKYADDITRMWDEIRAMKREPK